MNDIRQLPPSERAAAQADAEAKQKAISARRIALLREDFGRTFQTEHGKRVLAWLFDRCGYDKPKLAANAQGIIDETITTHNAMEEGLYIAIRKFIPVEVLQQIEYGFVKPSGSIETEENVKKKSTKKKG